MGRRTDAFVDGGTDANYMNKIILADNQAIFRAGTAKILAMEDDFRIIAQCPDSERLYQAIDAFRGVVLMFASTLKTDLSLLVERVAHAGSRSIAILENSDQPQPFLTAGVQGLVYRNVSGPALIDCARRVAGGERFQQPASGSFELLEEDVVGARVRDRLTSKEMKIVALIVQGCKNKEIAIRLRTTCAASTTKPAFPTGWSWHCLPFTIKSWPRRLPPSETS
jgi:DNA-binding NarL/FixJ family response regulator